MTRRAVVLSGGGSRGAFEVGALDYLIRDRHLEFDVIAGVSTGSLNAVMLAQGAGAAGLLAQLDALKGVWFNIRSHRDIYTKPFLGEILAFVWRQSIYNPRPIREKIRRQVSPERLRASGRQLRIGAVALETGAYRQVTQDDAAIREWTLASSSMPLMLPPVPIGSEHAVDGGVRNVTPLADALEALRQLGAAGDPEPPELYLVVAQPFTIPRREPKWPNGKTILRRGVDIMVGEIFREDVRQAITVNRSVEAYGEIRRELAQRLGDAEAKRLLRRLPYRPPEYLRVTLFAVVPTEWYSDDLEFDPAKIRRAFEAGRAAAASPLDETALERLLEE
jgi:NTE family protein